jgi:hypothetical protein
MEAFTQSLLDLGYGFVMAVIFYSWVAIGFILWRENRGKTKPNVAVMPSVKDWQYIESYFNKIEEFRNDFAS